MALIKTVAVIGAGPAGAIAVDALAQEKAFDVIRVFERREEAGGCWFALLSYIQKRFTKHPLRLQDPPGHEQQLPDLAKIAERTADTPLSPPPSLPATVPGSNQYRFSDTSIYPHLETNIDAAAMSFSQEPMPAIRSDWSIQNHGPDTPFRHWSVVQQYIASLLTRSNYASLVSYSTTVEHVQKSPQTGLWTLTLRKPLPGTGTDYWWSETFDAVVVASGHYIVPFIPFHAGLAEFAAAYPGTVTHSKSFRDPQSYAGKKVVVVGASISGPDIASSIAPVVAPPLYSIVRGKYHPYFFDYAFQHPKIERHPPIARFDSSEGKKAVVLEDGTRIEDVDAVIFGTGYSWTLPFLPSVEVRNNRVPGLYQHVFWREDPTLCFVGAVSYLLFAARTAADFTCNHSSQPGSPSRSSSGKRSSRRAFSPVASRFRRLLSS